MSEEDISSRAAQRSRRKQWLAEHRMFSSRAGRELSVREFLIATGSLRPQDTAHRHADEWTKFHNRADEPALRIRPLSIAEQEVSDRTVYRFTEHPKKEQQK